MISDRGWIGVAIIAVVCISILGWLAIESLRWVFSHLSLSWN